MKKIFACILCALIFTIEGSANTHLYKALKTIPQADDIIAFSNGRRPATGRRRKLTKEAVLEFLSKGRKADWGMTKIKKIHHNSVCDGILVDKIGQVYFWELSAPKILHLEIESGEEVYIYLQ